MSPFLAGISALGLLVLMLLFVVEFTPAPDAERRYDARRGRRPPRLP